MADRTSSPILQRIARSLGGDSILAALAGLSPRDLYIGARDPSGLSLPIVDGGFTRWTQELLGDRRE